MKHFAYGCGMALGGWLVFALAIAFGLQYRYGLALSATPGVAAGAGLLGWIACALLFSAVVAVRERFAVRAAMDGEPPRDGPRAVVIGTVQGNGDPLRAPFNGEECFAYDYKVVDDNGKHGKQRRVVTAFEGKALAPCTIASGAGYFRLFTVPELDPDTTASTGITVEAAQRFVAATAFKRAHVEVGELDKRWDDDDGSYRSDLSNMPPDEVSWSRAKLDQHVLRPRTAVCVIGHFSSERRGFVPAPVWGKATYIYQCSGEQLLSTLIRSAFWRAVWFLVFAAGAVGVVWAFVADHF